MSRPRFSLRTLLFSVGCLSAGFACLRAAFTLPRRLAFAFGISCLFILGIACLGAGVGALFDKPLQGLAISFVLAFSFMLFGWSGPLLAALLIVVWPKPA